MWKKIFEDAISGNYLRLPYCVLAHITIISNHYREKWNVDSVGPGWIYAFCQIQSIAPWE